jgi:uncharacterized membrane protein YphA (DoxX/SURF4 family)
MRWSVVLRVVRIFLGLIFITYGVVKVLGGQYNYGDWVLDKKTVDGTSLVWAFFGYSQIYGRFTGLFELGPAIMLLIPKTATIGAALLFAVSLNITVMDFAYGYPAVKYLALLYTVLLGGLLWADRRKLALLLETTERATAAFAAVKELPPPPAISRTARRILAAAVALFALGGLNLLATSLSGIPIERARAFLTARVGPADQIDLVRARQTGLLGLRWKSTMEFAIRSGTVTDTVTVEAWKTTGFLPWRIDSTRTGR